MVDLIGNLKQRARRMQRDDQDMKRRECLATLAKALGFRGWPHAKAVLSQPRSTTVDDYGELMFRDNGGALWNIWSADLAEAQAIRREHGGFLLPYRRQFFVAEPAFIEWLELDPTDPDWAAVGRDWVCPEDDQAWARLTARVIERRLARAL